jgi:type I restriction enzyme S subunit
MSNLSLQLDRLGVATVPVGWNLSNVGSACTIRNDLRLPLAVEVRESMKGKFPYFGPTGILGYINEFRVDGEYALIGEDGDHFLDVKEKRQTIRVSGKLNVNNHAHLIGGGPDCNVDWFFYFFQHRDIYHSLTRQGAGRFKLTKAALEKLPILLPPVLEQRKIAAILRTWDEAIERLDTLLVTKQRCYTLLADQLIFGERRHTDHRIERDSIRLGDVTRELNKRNRDGELGRDVVMGVTNTRGIVPMREQTIGGDLSRYQILPPRAFAYNPMRINVGSIAMSRFSSEVLVSPDYVLFECLPGKLDPDYLDHLRQSHFWAHYINAGGSGSVRMRTYYDDLAALKIKLPGILEQQAISAVLNTLQHEISLIDKERKAITRQKRGLMQKLLTGELRVKVETH